MLKAAEDLQHQYPDRLKIIKAEGVPFAQYQQMLDGSDALMDQLYGYTPAMNALQGMAHGLVCVGGGEPENYDILGETQLRPIINVQPDRDDVFRHLEELLLHPEQLPLLKQLLPMKDRHEPSDKFLKICHLVLELIHHIHYVLQ